MAATDRQPIRPAGLEVRRDQARGIGLTQLRHGRHHTATLETVVSDPDKARSEVESSAKGLAVALRSRGRARWENHHGNLETGHRMGCGSRVDLGSPG